MKISIEKAQRYLGTPYVWGGESYAEGGFDCSGFVYNVLNDSGIKVSRTTAQGYYTHFKKYEVAKTNICSGDLLFFGKSKSSISHIAIAISNSEMIESIGTKKNTKNNKGKGVTISKITRRKDLVAVCRFENVSCETLTPPTPVLKRGSMGTKVEQLQKCLNVFGYGLVTDGIYGEKTYKSVMDFQYRNGLVIDGKYGPYTYDKLRSKLNGN